MSDNTTINPGSGGNVIATDDVGGVHYPRTKIHLGADGVAGGDVTKTNPLPVSIGSGQSSTGTLTTATSSTTDVVILASNVARTGGYIWNDSTATLYIACSNVTSSSTNCSFAIAPKQLFKIDAGYTGVIKGIWSAVNGTARVTEFT